MLGPREPLRNEVIATGYEPGRPCLQFGAVLRGSQALHSFAPKKDAAPAKNADRADRPYAPEAHGVFLSRSATR